MRLSQRALLCVPLLPLAAAPAFATDTPADPILVTASQPPRTIENVPSTQAGIDADTIATTINAVNTEDALKYLPSLLVRKRHIGDTQAPLATRTSGLGSSARSLIYADGVLLSALIGNNNSTASPRWSLVSPQQIASVDVLYGPFSAAYPGNSIGTVVNITTKMPNRLVATATVGTSMQTFGLYGTHSTLPGYQAGGTVGDRFGPLSLFASVNHVDNRGQPLLFVTGTQPAGTTGGIASSTRTGTPTTLLGASGIEHNVEDQIGLRAALDITSGIRLSYNLGLFLNDTGAGARTYLTAAATGQPAYSSGFASGIYRYDERHWAHALNLSGHGDRLDWQVVGTLYDFAHDVQRMPTGTPPAAFDGGPGTITRLNGTGWKTLDAKGIWRSDGNATHSIGFGAHGDWFTLNSNRYATADWIDGAPGRLNLQSTGKTRTAALWLQDAWKFAPHLTLTVGGRYEWWRAYDGTNFCLSPALFADQPRLAAHHVSPKASLAWEPDKAWTVRLSFGEAWRFPTVGELYQIVTAPVPAVPNPDLKPERALSEELAIEHHDDRGTIRLSLFNEAIRDALISQVGPLNGTTTLATFVQNVDRTLARGVEFGVNRTDLLPRFDLSGSVTYTDAETAKDVAFPGADGKLLPQVPRCRATAVGNWRPVDRLSLTAAGRLSSRNFGTIDNSDTVGTVFQGFGRYAVVDLRAELKVNDHLRYALGVDNVNNDKYFLFHPFPQRTFFMQLGWTL